MRLGNVTGAAAAFQKALGTASPASAMEHRDVPALYVIAEAQAGSGDVAAARARSARSREEKSALLVDAKASYEHSADTWRQIPNPSRISPCGFLSSGLQSPAMSSKARVDLAKAISGQH
jgi:hypothetical protein